MIMNQLKLLVFLNRHAMARASKIRKRSSVLFLALVFTANAYGYAQNVSLNVKATPLEKVLKSIRTQSGYDFVYSSDLLNNASPVTLNVTNMPIEKLLPKVFQGQNFTYTLEEKTVIIKASPVSKTVKQQSEISGRITDASGSPLIGVTVKV